MRITISLALALVLAATFTARAHANPALHGTWSAANVNGRPLVVVFKDGGTGTINGQPMRWQTLGQLLAVEQNGQTGAYSFQVQGNELKVSGGDLPGLTTFTRGTAAADAAKKSSPRSAGGQGGAGTQQGAGGVAPAQAGAQSSSDGRELVGKWCLLSNFRANSGGSSRMTCFDLKPDGTYTYQHESSISASTGSAASQSSDAGRWRVNGNQLIAQSQRGGVRSYALEKRNHPKNKRDPMICLDGECYVSYYNKPAW